MVPSSVVEYASATPVGGSLTAVTVMVTVAATEFPSLASARYVNESCPNQSGSG
jgi:hypothetical protein